MQREPRYFFLNYNRIAFTYIIQRHSYFPFAWEKNDNNVACFVFCFLFSELAVAAFRLFVCWILFSLAVVVVVVVAAVVVVVVAVVFDFFANVTNDAFVVMSPEFSSFVVLLLLFLFSEFSLFASLWLGAVFE